MTGNSGGWLPFTLRVHGNARAGIVYPPRIRSLGEIAPFRLISPPMRFPPQAVISGSSPRTVFPLAPYVPRCSAVRKRGFRAAIQRLATPSASLRSALRAPGRKNRKDRFPSENPARAAKPRDTITVGGVPPTPPPLICGLTVIKIREWLRGLKSAPGLFIFLGLEKPGKI